MASSAVKSWRAGAVPAGRASGAEARDAGEFATSLAGVDRLQPAIASPATTNANVLVTEATPTQEWYAPPLISFQTG